MVQRSRCCRLTLSTFGRVGGAPTSEAPSEEKRRQSGRFFLHVRVYVIPAQSATGCTPVSGPTANLRKAKARVFARPDGFFFCRVASRVGAGFEIKQGTQCPIIPLYCFFPCPFFSYRLPASFNRGTVDILSTWGGVFFCASRKWSRISARSFLIRSKIQWSSVSRYCGV